MLARHNAFDVERALVDAPAYTPFPPAEDRAAWAALRTRLGPGAQTLLDQAARVAAEPVPPSRPASLVLDWLTHPARSEQEFDGSLTERRTRLSTLAIAECLEGDGRFLAPLLDVAWSLCEESSWAHPAHTRGLPDPHRPVIDLRVATYNYVDHGTGGDGYHLSVRSVDETTFTGDEFVYGRTLRELLTLQMLYDLSNSFNS